MKRTLILSVLLGTLFNAGFGDTPKLLPSFANVAYGTGPSQILDVYLPQGAGPFPVVMWIHGGGWIGGYKDFPGYTSDSYLKAGIALVSIDYRLIPDAVAQHISPPISAVLADNRRALQFVRLHAADWHLDPDKIVVSGGSAGAASALYLGCEGEQANPQSADPVERTSTKVLGVAVEAAQTSVDPQRIREWVPGVVWGYDAFEPDGDKWDSLPDFEHFLADRDKWLPEISKYSPDILLNKDTPPIFFFYSQPLPPAGAKPPVIELVHSPLWGIGFQKLARERGVECYLQYPDHPPEKYDSIMGFVVHLLKPDAK